MGLRVIRGGGETTPRRGDGPSSTRRLFFALALPAPIKEEVTRLVATFDLSPAEVRLVKQENLHITLKFLGDTPGASDKAVIDAARTAVADIAPFALAIEGLGVYPNHDKPRVLWLGVTGDVEKAQSLEQVLTTQLATLGVVPDERSYTPHLTVGRVVSDNVRGRLVRLIREQKGIGVGIMPVHSVTLFESALHADGSVYRSLATIKLKGK